MLPNYTAKKWVKYPYSRVFYPTKHPNKSIWRPVIVDQIGVGGNNLTRARNKASVLCCISVLISLPPSPTSFAPRGGGGRGRCVSGEAGCSALANLSFNAGAGQRRAALGEEKGRGCRARLDDGSVLRCSSSGADVSGCVCARGPTMCVGSDVSVSASPLWTRFLTGNGVLRIFSRYLSPI